MITLDTPLDRIQGFGLRFLAQLKKLHISTVRELLWHFPFRYEDFSQIYPVADLEPGQQATIQGMVKDVSIRRSWQKHIIVVEAKIADETGEIRAVWFNQPYIKNVLRPGRLANLSGKVTFSEGELYLTHPTYELVGRSETRHTARLVPIYPETRGLTSKGIRFFIQPVLKNLEPIPEWLPAEILHAHDLPNINQAIQNIHFPEVLESAVAAKRRFAFEDLFLLQLANLIQKSLLAKEKAPAVPVDLERLKKIVSELPFELTHSQKQALWEIIRDLGKPTPMNRLLQGDVGSGKTVVAAVAALLTALGKHQTAIMAPTEVLARQHYRTFQKLFRTVQAAGRPTVALFTASETKIFYDHGLESEVKKAELQRRLERGEIDIVIGTHALIAGGKQSGLAFPRLGLVIIDEQHRFGVDQRAHLAGGGRRRKTGTPLPHFLSMSATPIPRTLMLTVFGDLDISTITELPAGRQAIITEVVPPEGRARTYEFIRKAVQEGRQAFVICPRIEKADLDDMTGQRSFLAADARSVKEEYEHLATKVFPDLRVGMLHGQLPAKGKGTAARPTKESVMREFQEGRLDILVSTSVIEVGVDVPNATIMLIEGADRFGLAQLYQFRGRVGRGEYQSYCFLFTDSSGQSVKERLRAIQEAKNGFELAERDLQIRGPGELMGEKQTGLPDILMNSLQDIELIKKARAAALAVLQKNHNLAAYPALRERLESFRKRIHLE
ncbi:MAG TPA: ATP-dependent DNA helicase RecG [Candidatus Paceibacterota bacterium]|nr:ATP-dependent DNA helicase RecG [Candidatus Paceibacterota bacterium]